MSGRDAFNFEKSVLYTKLAPQETQRIPLTIFLIRKYKITKENDVSLFLFIFAFDILHYFLYCAHKRVLNSTRNQY